MKNPIRRREFIKTTTAGGIGLGLTSKLLSTNDISSIQSGRIGIIGLDTSYYHKE